MDNADQLDCEEKHKACFQLMFFSEIEEEFRQLKQGNGKFKNQNKKVMEQNQRLESQLKEMEQEKQRWDRESSQIDDNIKLLQKEKSHQGQPSSSEISKLKAKIRGLENIHLKIKSKIIVVERKK